MVSLFDYLDYRVYLHDFYEAQKKSNAYFSYRYIGRKTNLDAGYVVKILQGKLHIPEKYIDGFCSLCKFSPKENLFFRTLIDFNKAKSESQTKRLFEKILTFKSFRQRRVDEFQYEYYHKWYYAAVRSLIGIVRFTGDYESLASMLTPRLTVREVKKAVALLEKLKLIHKEPSGEYVLTDKFVTTGESWHTLAVKEFQRETLRLATESLDRHKKGDRDISTVTVAINKNDLVELKERITDFRESILKLASESNDPDGVYQLNVQLFPMAENKAGRS
jgi:uncharacterized protein (TIGR02147 family)